MEAVSEPEVEATLEPSVGAALEPEVVAALEPEVEAPLEPEVEVTPASSQHVRVRTRAVTQHPRETPPLRYGQRLALLRRRQEARKRRRQRPFLHKRHQQLPIVLSGQQDSASTSGLDSAPLTTIQGSGSDPITTSQNSASPAATEDALPPTSTQNSDPPTPTQDSELAQPISTQNTDPPTPTQDSELAQPISTQNTDPPTTTQDSESARFTSTQNTDPSTTTQDSESPQPTSTQNTDPSTTTQAESAQPTSTQSLDPPTITEDSFPPTTSRVVDPPITIEDLKIPTTPEDSAPTIFTQDSAPSTSTQDSVPPTTSEDPAPPTTTEDLAPLTPTQDSAPSTNDDGAVPLATTEGSVPLTFTRNPALRRHPSGLVTTLRRRAPPAAAKPQLPPPSVSPPSISASRNSSLRSVSSSDTGHPSDTFRSQSPSFRFSSLSLPPGEDSYTLILQVYPSPSQADVDRLVSSAIPLYLASGSSPVMASMMPLSAASDASVPSVVETLVHLAQLPLSTEGVEGEDTVVAELPCVPATHCFRHYGNQSLDECVYGLQRACREGAARCLDQYLGPLNLRCFRDTPPSEELATEPVVTFYSVSGPVSNNEAEDQTPAKAVVDAETSDSDEASESPEVVIPCVSISSCGRRYGSASDVSKNFPLGLDTSGVQRQSLTVNLLDKTPRKPRLTSRPTQTHNKPGNNLTNMDKKLRNKSHLHSPIRARVKTRN
ncbi:proteoglycan 4-like [Eriocheir sinensis]|uniref:proteoglycan 4-like n=1 Tax=Eriocheir sinensis TaxID=95602 RepID=UPI0021C8A0DA|nr:proteoglycan 4-like [Eriocheir sinensis]